MECDAAHAVDAAELFTQHTHRNGPRRQAAARRLRKPRPCRNTDIMRARVHLDILEFVCGAMIKKNIKREKERESITSFLLNVHKGKNRTARSTRRHWKIDSTAALQLYNLMNANLRQAEGVLLFVLLNVAAGERRIWKWMQMRQIAFDNENTREENEMCTPSFIVTLVCGERFFRGRNRKICCTSKVVVVFGRKLTFHDTCAHVFVSPTSRKATSHTDSIGNVRPQGLNNTWM